MPRRSTKLRRKPKSTDESGSGSGAGAGSGSGSGAGAGAGSSPPVDSTGAVSPLPAPSKTTKLLVDLVAGCMTAAEDSDAAAKRFLWNKKTKPSHRALLIDHVAPHPSWVDYAASASTAAERRAVEKGTPFIAHFRQIRRYQAQLRDNDVQSSFLKTARTVYPTKRRRKSRDDESGDARVTSDVLQTVFDASVHIVSDGSGSGICIHPSGIILTCAHCIPVPKKGEDEEEEEEEDDEEDDTPPINRVGRVATVMFPSGMWGVAHCVAASEELDVALLAMAWTSTPGVTTFPFVSSFSRPEPSMPVVLVGNPAEVDLEDGGKYGKISFFPPIFHTSEGEIGDVQEPGASTFEDAGVGLVSHDAWTYWGHSGGALCSLAPSGDGMMIVALHSSWDNTRTLEEHNRHGIPAHLIHDWLPNALKPSTTLF